MAVQKRRQSRARHNTRRNQVMAKTASGFTACPNCGEAKLPHRICPSCGFYKGREIEAKGDEESA